MDVFKRMIRDYEEQKEREYELANPCTHRESSIQPFTWDGITMCGNCCKHEYRDKIVKYNGYRLCLLCAEQLEPIFQGYTPIPRITAKKHRANERKRIPGICVFDENGKRVKVRYAKLGIQK